MVSLKCRLAVQARLTKLGVLYRFEEPGIVEVFGNLGNEAKRQITEDLENADLPLLADNERVLIEKTEKAIASIIVNPKTQSEQTYAGYISSHTNTDYNELSKLFVDLKGVSIPHYIVYQKVERAKELLLYTDKKVGEVASELHFGSPSRLTYQFRNLTGLSPSFFKKLRQKRIELSHLNKKYTSNINSTELKDETLHQVYGKSSVQNRSKKRA